MDINTLRAMRNKDFGHISSAFDKIANPQTETKSYKDDRFWRLEGDKAGNGTATIRFLPRVKVMNSHGCVFSLTVSKVQLVSGTSKTL